MILLFCFVGGGVVWVIGRWLGTYRDRIVILVIGYIGLGLVIVIVYTLICLLGGGACRLGIFSHCV